jgi:hypothetical protein
VIERERLKEVYRDKGYKISHVDNMSDAQVHAVLMRLQQEEQNKPNSQEEEE